MHYDIVIIGSGISGSSIAMELSKYQLNVALIEKENDVAMLTTKANSGIAHAGYDPKPGTKMAYLNVKGNKMIRELAPILNFHFNQIGSLVIGSTDDDHKIINELYNRGIKNEVPGLKILKTQKEVHDLEPSLSPEIDYALYAPTAGVVSPWEMCLAFANTAVYNGVKFINNCKVNDITKQNDKFILETSKGQIESTYVINAAGLEADDMYRLVLKDNKDKSFDITPCKGEYYLLDKDQGKLVNRVIFQTPSNLGKGVLVSPTVHGNLIVGPDANYDVKSKDDMSNTSSALSYVKAAASKTTKNIYFGANIRNFAGERATIKGYDDFVIENSPYVNGFINFAGIKSPGLTSAPAFGDEACKILSDLGVKLVKKPNFKYYKLPTFFANMTLDEKIKAIKENALYGQVICRCETVTEAEIINAMNQPIPGTTIDGIKRRTNAGMGRCQGGFCGPKIYQLLKEHFNLDFDKVYQDREGSTICVCKTKKEDK